MLNFHFGLLASWYSEWSCLCANILDNEEKMEYLSWWICAHFRAFVSFFGRQKPSHVCQQIWNDNQTNWSESCQSALLPFFISIIKTVWLECWEVTQVIGWLMLRRCKFSRKALCIPTENATHEINPSAYICFNSNTDLRPRYFRRIFNDQLELIASGCTSGFKLCPASH